MTAATTEVGATIAAGATGAAPPAPPFDSGCPTGHETPMLVYVYGVASATDQDFASLPLIDGHEPDRPVRFVVSDALVAVVSTVSAAAFGRAALKAKLDDVTWAQARVLDHHRVLMALSDMPLLPFKFCTVFADETRVTEALARHSNGLAAGLAQTRDASEWGVKLFIDDAAAGRHLCATLPGLTALSRKADMTAPGTAFFLKRRLERMVRDAVDKTTGRWVQAIHTAIARKARAAAIQTLQPPDLHGRTERMVLNGAYLVPRAAEPAFHRAIDDAARRYGGRGFDVEMIGPMPPYSFVTVDANGQAVGAPAIGATRSRAWSDPGHD